MENRIRVFIKTHRTGRSFDAFSCIVLGNNGKSAVISAEGLSDSDLSRHRITLEAIRRFLTNIDDSERNGEFRLVFYADNDEIAYEWNNEYLKEGSFAGSTEDQDLYKAIIKILNRKHLSMEVIGKDNVLSSMKNVI